MPTLEQAKKAWLHMQKGKQYYDAMTDEQKKAAWQYGYDRGLVQTDKLGPGASAEYQKYVNPSRPEYKPQASIVRQNIPQPIQTQNEKIMSAITPSIVKNMVSQSPEQMAADRRRILNEERLAEYNPPQPIQPRLPQTGNIRQQQPTLKHERAKTYEAKGSFDPLRSTGKLALDTLSTIGSVLQTPATMGKYGVEAMEQSKAEGKSPIGGLLKGYGIGLKKAITNQDAVENAEVLEGVAPKTTAALKEKFPNAYNAVSTIVNLIGVDDLTAIGLLGDIAKVRKLNKGINTTADLMKMSQAGIKDAEKIAKLMQNPDVVRAVDGIPEKELNSLPRAKQYKTLTKEISELPANGYVDEYLDSIGEYEKMWNQQKASINTPKSDILNTKGVDNVALDSVNPTGGVFAKYNPESRMNAELADNITTLAKTSGHNPDDKVTIYRGIPKGIKSTINSGDFITTNKQLAKDYAGDGQVISLSVRYGDVLDDISEPLGEEYIFRPSLSSGIEKKITANGTPSGVFSLQPPKLEAIPQRKAIGQTLKPIGDLRKLPTTAEETISNINTPPIQNKPLTGALKPSKDIPTKGAKTIQEVIEKAPMKKDISGFQAYTTDVYRNFENVFGDDYAAVKKEILDPFDNAKKAKTVEDRKLMTGLKQNIVDKLGINKKSKESALVQQFGEKRISYESLVDKVGKAKADKIVAADKWFRSEYDRLIDEVNAA
ncbi:MAG: hypothetical protein PHE51_09770, partial [Eubacteriales bacterium]|nr:hypothetical protein [Eubacteriales bacterium]